MDGKRESCPTRIILLIAWQSAAEIYSKAVAELSQKIGKLSKEEYEKLKKNAEIARQHSIDAQATLEAHTHDHGCDGNGNEAAA